MKREQIPLMAAAVLMLVLVVALLASVANAHDWMPQSMRYCCDDRNCLPHPREALERTAGGWVVKATGQIFPDGSPDIHPNLRPDLAPVWICQPPWMTQARCIMVSPEGS